MVGIENDAVLAGVIPRVFQHCRQIVVEDEEREFLVHASFLEIYNENVFDLLSNNREKLKLKQDPQKGVFVEGLKKEKCSSLEDMRRVMSQGNKNRSVGATAMNEESSRSHSIFTLFIESGFKAEQKKKFVASKLSLVDLAGSEKTSKTHSSGQRLVEGTKINLSLSVLGNVIKALVDGKSKFIPYRESKLTMLLQDSLGGNTKTVMISAISPAHSNFEETLSTLRYTNRAKNIKNKPVINEDEKDLKIKQYLEEINQIKAQLGQSPPPPPNLN